MSDQANPMPELADEEFKLEVVESVEPQKDEATLSLEAKIAELEAEKEQLKAEPQPDPSMAMLAEALKDLKKPSEPSPPTGTAPETPQVDWQALFKETDENIYKTPSESIIKLMTPALQQMKAETDKQVQTLSVANSKLSALSLEDNKAIYGKYADEVEQIAKTLPQNQQVYQTAINQVKMNHFQEIVAEQAQKIAAESVNAQADAVAQQAIAQQQTVTSAGVPPQAKPKPKQVTPSQKKVIDQWMLVKGYNPKDQSDVEFAYNYLKKRGAI